MMTYDELLLRSRDILDLQRTGMWPRCEFPAWIGVLTQHIPGIDDGTRMRIAIGMVEDAALEFTVVALSLLRQREKA